MGWHEAVRVDTRHEQPQVSPMVPYSLLSASLLSSLLSLPPSLLCPPSWVPQIGWGQCSTAIAPYCQPVKQGARNCRACVPGPMGRLCSSLLWVLSVAGCGGTGHSWEDRMDTIGHWSIEEFGEGLQTRFSCYSFNKNPLWK